MRVTIVYLIIPLIFVGIFSCKEKGVPDEEATIIGYNSYLTEEFKVSDHFKRVDVVPLETNESCLLGDVHDVVAHDSIVVITDHLKNVLAFDINGKFRYRVGNLGRGPQEYLSVGACYIDPFAGSINIIEISPARIHSYGISDGKYISSRELSDNVTDWCVGAKLVNKKELLFCYHINPFESRAYALYDLETNKVIANSDSYQVTLEGYMYQFSRNPMSVAEDGVDFIMPIDPVIYNVSENGFSKRYKIELPSKLIDTKLMDLTEDEFYLWKIIELAKDGDFPGFYALFESDDRLFLPFLDKGRNPGLFIANKNTLRGNYYACRSAAGIKEVPFLGDGGIPGELFTSSEDYIVGVASTHRMEQYKASLADISDNAFNRSFVDALNRFREEDNPCLFLYYFR